MQDDSLADHYYAFVSDYLEFDTAVPFKDGEFYYESGLKKPGGKTNLGSAQRAVRNLPDAEYDLILQSGYAADIGARNDASISAFEEEQETFDRPIVERLVARPFRDRAFARQVKTAYENTCAMTGLKIVNGGGRPEVQAAHIRPVEDNGPDSVRNGLALSGTIHWMFDRGLISIDDDYSLLVAKDSVPDTVGRLLNEDGTLRLPSSVASTPHRQFLRFHRENKFKG